jgi:hypothetical protein
VSVFDPQSALEALDAVKYAVVGFKVNAVAAGSEASLERDQFFYTGRIGAFYQVISLLDTLREEYENG